MTVPAEPVGERRVNLAVIGIGRWGHTLMHAIEAQPGMSLAAAIGSGRRGAVTGDVRVPVFPSWQAAAEAFPVDGFVLAVPPDVQPEIAEQIITAGVPVFLEKPLAVDRGSAARLLTVARQFGFTGIVNHIHLYAGEFQELCRRLPDEGPRTVASVSGNKGPLRERWSACWDWAPHDIAMCVAVMGVPPRSVAARIERSIEEGGAVFENYEIDLDFGPNGRARILTGNAFDEHRREFRVQVNGAALTYAESAERERSLAIEQGGQAKTAPVAALSPLSASLTAFAHRIRNNSSGLEDLQRGVLIVDICAAAHESVRCGAPVRISAP